MARVLSEEHYHSPWYLVDIKPGDSIIQLNGTLQNNHSYPEITLYAQGYDDTDSQVSWTLDAAHIVGQIGLHVEKGEQVSFTLHLNHADTLKTINLYANHYQQTPP